MSKVIVYFSKSNNTRAGGKILAERTGAKVVELKEVRKGNFIQAIRKKSSKLEGKPWEEIEDAETLYLMTPIWASNGVPAINAFLDRADLNEKEVIIITFQQFQDLKDSENVHDYIKNRVIAKNGRVSATYALVGGKIGHFAGEDHIKTQLDQIVN